MKENVLVIRTGSDIMALSSPFPVQHFYEEKKVSLQLLLEIK